MTRAVDEIPPRDTLLHKVAATTRCWSCKICPLTTDSLEAGELQRYLLQNYWPPMFWVP